MKNLSRLLAVIALCSVCSVELALAQTASSSICQTYANGQRQDCVELIAPLNVTGDSSQGSVDIGDGYTTMLHYYDQSRQWIETVAVGFTIVWVLNAGLSYMISGGDSAKKAKAISRMTWAIIGLLILLFSGYILRVLNSIFFQV